MSRVSTSFLGKYWMPLAAVVASWAFFRRYSGIRHDAQLYFVDALAGDDVAFQTRDLLISHDSQMQYSVYSRLLRRLVAFVPVGTAGIVVTAASLVAWVGGISYLARTLSSRWWWVIVVMVPAVGAPYGPYGILWFAESFPTPRPIAEAIVLVAIALALRGRSWVAVVVALTALIVHPLVTVSGLIAVVCINAVTNSKWRSVLLVGTVLGAGFVWLDPLAIGGASTIDAEWLEVLVNRSPHLFLHTWKGIGWESTIVSVLLLAAIGFGRSSTARPRVFARGLLMATVLGLGLTFLLADLVGSPLGTQLQFWRTTWLGQVGAGVAIGLLVIRAIEQRSVSDVSRAMLGGLVVTMPWLMDGAGFVLSATLLAAIFVLLERSDTSESQPGSRIPVVVIGVILGALVAVQAVGLILYADSSILTAAGSAILPVLAPGAAIAVGALLITAVLLGRRGGPWGIGIGILLAAAALLSVMTWDGRSDWVRYVEGPEQPALAAPANAVVLVEDDGFSSFSLFQRPSYYTAIAGAGSVFSRPLALEYEARRQQVDAIGFIGAQVHRFDPPPMDEATLPDRGAVIELCRASADPLVILLRRPVIGLESTVWRPAALAGTEPIEDSVVEEDRFYRYDCDEIISLETSSPRS